MKRILNFSFVGMAILLVAVAVATPFGLSAGSLFGAGAVVAGASTVTNIPGVINAGLNKEIWLPELMEGFYANDGIMAEFTDLSAFVDNDTINLAEAGVDPNVLLNNTGTIGYAQRADIPLELPLETLDTENTLLKNIETAELAYDKRKSILAGHTNALRMFFLERAFQNIAPATDGTYTPRLVATGADNGSGLKRLTWADVRKLQRRFDDAEIPQEGRNIAFTTQHLEDLELEDLTRFNRVMDKGVICTFKMQAFASKRMPRYHRTTGAKIAFKAAAAPTTDSSATIAWCKAEVMKAKGSSDMFLREKDPELRGDVVGFQQRALSMPLRNKGIAAIYSPAAA